MPLMSLRGYAKHRGVTLRAVQKAIESGRIETVVNEKGKERIDSEEADKRWDELSDPSKQPMPSERLSEIIESLPDPNQVLRESEKGDGEADIEGALDPDLLSNVRSEETLGEKPPNYFVSKAMRESYLARIAKLKYLQCAGELVEVKQVQSEIFELTRKTRDAILNIPSRIAAELASETDPVRVHNLLTEALTRSLEELVNACRSP